MKAHTIKHDAETKERADKLTVINYIDNNEYK